MQENLEEKSNDDTILPVTSQRIRKSLQRLDYQYFVNENGCFCTFWNSDKIIFIYTMPEYINIRSTYIRKACMDFANPFKSISDSINLSYMEVKTFITSDDSGQNAFHIENTLDVTCGLNDKQLDSFIALSFRCILDIWTHIDESFPDPLLVSDGEIK